MTAAVLSELYHELDGLLAARARDFPHRAEPTWSRLVERLETVGGALRERARPRGHLEPSEAARSLSERLLPAGVFVVGFPKSGTSLLRNLLDGHPELAVVPAKETKHFVDFLPQNAHLPRVEQVDRIQRRWLTWLINPAGQPPFWLLGRPWELEADPYELFTSYFYRLADRHPGQDLLGVFATALAVARLDSGTLAAEPRAWVEKSPQHELRAAEIVAAYPAARFVHVVRDPRSTVAALRRMDMKQDVWAASRELQWSLDAARRNPELLGPDRYLVVRYEDLIAEPRAVLERVAGFLGIAFDERLLVPTTAGQPATANSAWEQRRVRGEIHALSLDSWRGELDGLELALVLARTSARARELGYELPAPSAPRSVAAIAAGGARHLARRLAY